MDLSHTPDIVRVSDEIRLDRTKLLARIHPAHKNLTSFRYEALVSGDRIAARFTIHVLPEAFRRRSQIFTSWEAVMPPPGERSATSRSRSLSVGQLDARGRVTGFAPAVERSARESAQLIRHLRNCQAARTPVRRACRTG
jgi:hypothetical protein